MKKLYILTLLAFTIACTDKKANPPVDTNTSTDTAASVPSAPSLPVGKFVSTDDPLSNIEFKDGNFIESYEGKVLGTYACNFAPDCTNCAAANSDANDTDEQNSGCFSYSDGGENYCFIIQSMSADAIEYVMLGGRGNTLSYIRSVTRYQPGDQLTALAKSGVVLRQKPDVKSPKLGRVEYGQQVTVSGASGAAYKLEVLPGFTIHGNWAPVRFGEKTGYVFDGFFSKFQAPKDTPFEALMTGAKSTGKTSTNPSKTDKNTAVWLREIETFSNGVKYETLAYEGGSTSIERYPIRLISLTEAYLLLQGMESAKGTWSIDPEDNSLRFDAADELSATILKVENGYVVVEMQTAD